MCQICSKSLDVLGTIWQHCSTSGVSKLLGKNSFDYIYGTMPMRDRDIGGWVIVIVAIVRTENPCDVWAWAGGAGDN